VRHSRVIPAKAGIQWIASGFWIPAFARSRQLKESWRWHYGLRASIPSFRQSLSRNPELCRYRVPVSLDSGLKTAGMTINGLQIRAHMLKLTAMRLPRMTTRNSPASESHTSKLDISCSIFCSSFKICPQDRLPQVQDAPGHA
jgi:hypothetical protein